MFMSIQNFSKFMTMRVLFIFMGCILLLMATWVYQSSADFVDKARYAKDNNIRMAIIAQQMRIDVIQIQQWLTDISATRAQNGLDDGFVEAENSYNSFLSGLDAFEKFYASRDVAMLKKVKDLRGGVSMYYDVGKQMAHAYIDKGPAGGNQIMAHFDDASSGLYKALDPFVNAQVGALSLAMEVIVASASALKTVTVIVFSIVFFVTAVGLFLQNKNSQQQIEKILNTVQDAATGDLTVSMHENTGQMAKVSSAINNLLNQFAQVILKVKENADFVYVSAEEISEGNDDLSRRLQEQASSLEETASSMEEMTTTIRQNTESTNEAHNLVNATRDEAEKGRRVIEQAISAMDEINKSSGKIADIISTIDSIAFQTNLLALNAAVEAARAGEQGRGFAVVASEVRVLSQRSAEAAREIKTLIEDSVEKVRIGTQQVDNSGAALMSIVDGIKKVSDIVTEINNASQQQALGIGEVNTAVAHMDDRIQQNAAFVEQSSAATKRMKDQASVLNDVIAYFKLASPDAVGRATGAQPLKLEQHS